MGDPRTILRRNGLRAKKSWGQNFLVDRHVLAEIVAGMAIGAGDTVVELGAGTGALTEALAEVTGRVVAVERDPDMVGVLQRELGRRDNVEVLPADAVHLKLEQLRPASDGELLVVGNLPYNISSPILFSLLEQRSAFRSATVMLQEEVGRRLAADRTCGKEYSVLTVRFGLLFDVELLRTVPRQAFFPRPKVRSAVVRLSPLAEPRVPVADLKLYARTVKAAFAQRRKTLRNALGGGFSELDDGTVRGVLAELGVDERRRGETLELAEFARLADALGACLAKAGD